VPQLLQLMKRRLKAASRDRQVRIDLNRESRRLALSDLPDVVRADAINWLRRMDWRSRGSLPNPIELFGCSVGYINEEDLRYLFREILVEGDYLFRCETQRPVIYDCGSNIGLSVLFFKRLYPKAYVVAFEPDPLAFSMLKKNIEINRLANVQLNNLALNNEDGEIVLYRGAKTTGSLMMSTLVARQSENPIRVPAKRLSSFISGQIDLLKLDVEGAEHVVLSELATSGKLSLIKQIHLEYHHHIVPNEDRLSEIVKLLEQHGFGYQLKTQSRNWPIPDSFFFSKWPAPFAFQDLSIYCYKK
jgi:FkbM family methyltransferase